MVLYYLKMSQLYDLQMELFFRQMDLEVTIYDY